MKDELFKRIEEKLRLIRLSDNLISPEYFYQDLLSLSENDQIVFTRTFIFLRCKGISIPAAKEDRIIDEKDRIQAARLMLLNLRVGLGDPGWSSYVVENMWAFILETPGGRFNDLYKALWHLLDESNSPLSLMESRFIQAITFNWRIQFMTKYKTGYLKDDFKWMLDLTEGNLRNWEAYLLLYTLPEHYLSPQLNEILLSALAGTNYESEARSILPL